ncbi:hypothetical protein SBX64_18250 [Vibrio rhizosphaerae]|uniref:Uncharacterized protein n=1 Tax=Vibrio rhizosphaerae TaxID=398736 RepID=A0ABU4IYL2_9VIBR|nr:hypothetical protein [Vibrio rhizosphaerae]MDW6094486.1 hypothetical protein [Vibrio rhizosphaerae]
MTKPNKKDFLVRLSSLKDELAHRAPMPLKSLTLIVRQTATPEATTTHSNTTNPLLFTL